MWIWNFRNKSDSYSIYLTKELRRMKRRFNGCKNMRRNKLLISGTGMYKLRHLFAREELRTAREAVKIWCYRKCYWSSFNCSFCLEIFEESAWYCAALSFGAGAMFGWTFGHEFANHWLQLYRLDTMAAQVKFLDWWEKKSAGRA
ncbi:succinate dehydrogenase subunit [Actinidia rufa]|uniref:Succinate dehydrogenase subunit n=1 Tax=Actinidia rufa TaxID=165716 RepID=A0A7J0FS60_9ERIC|nr:succinate dehydrogenase subunit [Actinidia rufa]